MKRFLIVGALLIVVFAAGYLPVNLQLRELRQSSEQARRDLETRLLAAEERARVAALAASLGMVLIEVREDNYGKARERSTMFFDQLRSVSAGAAKDATKQQLTSMLTRRDEVTALLTANKPETSAKLSELFKELNGIIDSMQASQ